VTWLIRYWKPLAALVLIACAWCTGWASRGTHDRAARATELEKTLASIEDANLRAEKANVALVAELRKPKAADKVHEIIRENPVNCRVPKPVDDGVREAIRETNRSAG
jgi:hypothetical protein